MENPLVSGVALFGLTLGSVLMTQKHSKCLSRDSTSDSAIAESLIQEFIKKGVVVIPGVLSQAEINETRERFHEFLANHGVRLFLM
jgi:hypothetical protein